MLVAVGYGIFGSLLPVFARNHLDVSERVIGLMFLVNTVSIIALQLPIARIVEVRRRLRLLALCACTWSLACMLVLICTLFLFSTSAAAILALAALVFGVGECLHAVTLTPLVADLVPPALLGKAMALLGTSFSLGMAIAPAAGGFLLTASATGTWTASVALAAGLALFVLVVEPLTPAAVQRTPRRGRDLGEPKHDVDPCPGAAGPPACAARTAIASVARSSDGSPRSLRRWQP
jgi:MFS family permease